jgi:hypothetical protein
MILHRLAPPLSLTCVPLTCLLLAGGAMASSHREAPFITKFPQVDATDFYLFNSYESGREGYVSLIANYQPVEAAYAGPNYYPLDSEALYAIRIDNDGDSVEDLTFQFRFRDVQPSGGALKLNVGGKETTSVLRNIGPITAQNAAGLSFRETYTVKVIREGQSATGEDVVNASTGNRTFNKPFDYSGAKTFGGAGNYAAYANTFIHEANVPGCSMPARVFVGQRNEAFKISVGEIFDLVNLVPIEGDRTPGAGDRGGFPGGVTQDPRRNDLARNNVTSIAMEIHKSCLTSGSEPVIGAWTTASMRQVSVLNPRATFQKPEVTGGAFVQVSRLSNPLVNELVIGFDQKDRFNGSKPVDDGQFLTFVTHPTLPLILDSLFRDAVNRTLNTSIPNLAPSNFPRNDLVTAFLTGFGGLNKPANVVPGEMLRLNTSIAPRNRAAQHPLGVAAGDLAGFPNGRRPGDDVVDIALRVVMGALCHPVPIGAGGAPVALGLCNPGDAPVGNVPFTDGVPLAATHLNASFPYLLEPYPGSPVNSPLPQPTP